MNIWQQFGCLSQSFPQMSVGSGWRCDVPAGFFDSFIQWNVLVSVVTVFVAALVVILIVSELIAMVMRAVRGV